MIFHDYTMNPLMRDSVTAKDIPLDNLAAVAGYADGIYMWHGNDWALFPDPIVKLSIAVHPQTSADILDVETGDATPADCPGWCDRFIRQRRAPTIYCNLGNWNQCLAAVGSRRVDWWIADYTTSLPENVPPLGKAVAIQHWDFGGYDQSVVFDPTWLASEGDTLATIGQKRATVLNCRVASFGKWPSGLPEVDTYAGMIADDYSNVLDVLDRMIKDYIANGGIPFWEHV